MNNEQLIAHKVRLALDESADHLPFRITQRLEQSRLAALARAMPAQPELAVNRASPLTVALQGDDRPSVYFRLLSTVAPILLVIAGLYGIDAWNDAEEAAETADIDAELLLADDDVPVSAYADKGFGAFLKNSRQ
jgi:hypothetical protein